MHIKGFESLGADVSNEHGVIYLRTEEESLTGDRIFMDVVSIGATINVMLAAVKLKEKQSLRMLQRNQKLSMLQRY